MNQRAKIQAEYEYFLSNCLRASKTPVNKIFLQEGSAGDYVRYLNKVFDYCPDERKGVVNLFDITDPAQIKEIFDRVTSNKTFVDKDAKPPSQYFRSNSLKAYVCFVNARDFFRPPKGGDACKSGAKQIIFFGAPGTGKSHKIKEDYPERMPSENNLRPCDIEKRKQQFASSKTNKACAYSGRLDDSIYGLNSISELESKLAEVETKCEEEKIECGDSSGKMTENAKLRLALKSYIAFAKVRFMDVGNTFRTTFHPDYDYAQFVGSYKPKRENDFITYKFVPQVFAKAYAAAWSDLNQPVYLVIEEINRGNCAQIFGDIFQLLDRKDGNSEYSIEAEADFGEWLEEYGLSSKLQLPPNLSIFATMNTSDQSLFPMDSAFKRRFDWEYVPINYENPYKKDEEKDAYDKWDVADCDVDLEDGLTKFKWLHFLKKVNADIAAVTESEDKQMGEFFVKAKNGSIGFEVFRSKVLFYLWDSVYKDEIGNNTVFRFDDPNNKGTKVTFQSFFGKKKEESIVLIKQMMKNLDEKYKGDAYKDYIILESVSKEDDNSATAVASAE